MNKSKSRKDKHEALDPEEFVSFYYSLLRRPELEKVFARFARTEDGKMGPAEMIK